MTGLQELYTFGVNITMDNADHIVKGGLVAFAGDTLAANLVGGFKEGVG